MARPIRKIFYNRVIFVSICNKPDQTDEYIIQDSLVRLARPHQPTAIKRDNKIWGHVSMPERGDAPVFYPLHLFFCRRVQSRGGGG